MELSHIEVEPLVGSDVDVDNNVDEDGIHGTNDDDEDGNNVEEEDQSTAVSSKLDQNERVGPIPTVA